MEKNQICHGFQKPESNVPNSLSCMDAMVSASLSSDELLSCKNLSGSYEPRLLNKKIDLIKFATNHTNLDTLFILKTPPGLFLHSQIMWSFPDKSKVLIKAIA